MRPVLAAELIAWSLLRWVMSRWLQACACHSGPRLRSFPVAAAVALVIAVVTGSAHSIKVASSASVKALRYE